MAQMSIISRFAALALIILSVSAAAQDQDVPARGAPVINDETIGILRQQEAGSIILPQGTPPFAAVIVLHGCNGVSQNTRGWARRLASWGRS
jgi:poly(3-hydroxybutyrate) depolymerase